MHFGMFSLHVEIEVTGMVVGMVATVSQRTGMCAVCLRLWLTLNQLGTKKTGFFNKCLKDAYAE